MLVRVVPYGDPTKARDAAGSIDASPRSMDQLTWLACVRCPIGLPIGAQTPHELGIAIAAELIAARAGCLPRARY